MSRHGKGFYRGVMLLTIPPVAMASPLARIILNGGTAPLTVAFWRLLTAAVGSFIAILFVPAARKGLLQMGGRDVLRTITSGFFLAAHYLCWYTALERTTVFNATVLSSLQPFFALLGGWLLYKEKVRPAAILGIVLAVGGVAVMGLLSRGQGQNSWIGDGAALLAGLFFTVYLLWGQPVVARVPLLSYTALLYSACTAFLAIFASLTGTTLAAAPSTVGLCALLTVLATFLGHSVFNWALPHVGAVYVTVVLLGEPVGASIAAYFILHEQPRAVTLLGGLLVLAGVALYVALDSRRSAAPPEG